MIIFPSHLMLYNLMQMNDSLVSYIVLIFQMLMFVVSNERIA